MLKKQSRSSETERSGFVFLRINKRIVFPNGGFRNRNDYVVMVGKKLSTSKSAGVITERFIMKVQELGLNIYWTVLTHGKSKADTAKGETKYILAELEYDKTAGQ